MRCSRVQLQWARRFVVAFVLAAGFASTSASAEEVGKWRGRAVLVITAYKEVKVADKADHAVSMSEFDGLVFSEGEKPFLDKARYQVVDLTDTSGLVSGGYKTFTAEDGSQVFAEYKVTGGASPSYTGTWSFVTGTGKYKGITGSGTFNINFTSDTTAWDVLEGDYKIP